VLGGQPAPQRGRAHRQMAGDIGGLPVAGRVKGQQALDLCAYILPGLAEQRRALTGGGQRQHQALPGVLGAGLAQRAGLGLWQQGLQLLQGVRGVRVRLEHGGGVLPRRRRQLAAVVGQQALQPVLRLHQRPGAVTVAAGLVDDVHLLTAGNHQPAAGRAVPAAVAGKQLFLAVLDGHQQRGQHRHPRQALALQATKNVQRQGGHGGLLAGWPHHAVAGCYPLGA